MFYRVVANQKHTFDRFKFEQIQTLLNKGISIMYSTNRPVNSSFSQNTNKTNTSSLPQRLFTRREVIPPRNDVLWRI